MTAEEIVKHYASGQGGFVSVDVALRVIEYAKQEAKQQMMAKAVNIEVKEDAGGYPYIDAHIEFYDYDKDEPLAKVGDKAKIIIVSNS